MHAAPSRTHVSSAITSLCAFISCVFLRKRIKLLQGLFRTFAGFFFRLFSAIILLRCLKCQQPTTKALNLFILDVKLFWVDFSRADAWCPINKRIHLNTIFICRFSLSLSLLLARFHSVGDHVIAFQKTVYFHIIP